MRSAPEIVLTAGDPLGIGSEIVVKALTDPAVRAVCRPSAVGSREVLCAAARMLGINDFSEKYGDNIIDVPLPAGSTRDVNELRSLAGTVRAFAGQHAFDCIVRAHELCSSGKAKAVATAPVNKESLRAAGVPYIGHTEIFGALTGVKDPLTMFETDGLRIFFLTRHVSLRQACDLVTEDRIIDYLRRSAEALRKTGVRADEDHPIAVAGLNPHSGEHGLFGNEETEIIVPAVLKARGEGIPAAGPVSADSVFHLAHRGRFAAVLSLYHDQGHIAAKTLDFERTISITHGLPYLRTSVDHGTAFDIAWQGRAGAVSMSEAAILAAKYAF